MKYVGNSNVGERLVSESLLEEHKVCIANVCSLYRELNELFRLSKFCGVSRENFRV